MVVLGGQTAIADTDSRRHVGVLFEDFIDVVRHRKVARIRCRRPGRKSPSHGRCIQAFRYRQRLEMIAGQIHNVYM